MEAHWDLSHPFPAIDFSALGPSIALGGLVLYKASALTWRMMNYHLFVAAALRR